MGVSIVMGVPPIAGWFIRENPIKLHDMYIFIYLFIYLFIYIYLFVFYLYIYINTYHQKQSLVLSLLLNI